MTKAPLVAGNWKMNTTVSEGIALAHELCGSLADQSHVDVVLMPPFTHLWPISAELRDSAIELGAQDCYWESKGAYTGEISPAFLAGWCDWVLVGHSERRQLMGETDEDVARKMRAARDAGLKVIAAVGETQEERDAGQTTAVIDRQLTALLSAYTEADAASLAVAYEPVWAIGTGRTATPEQAEEVCARVAAGFSHAVRVLYGGSVTPGNATSLFSMPSINGALVGGAALKVQDFCAIVGAASGVGETVQ